MGNLLNNQPLNVLLDPKKFLIFDKFLSASFSVDDARSLFTTLKIDLNNHFELALILLIDICSSNYFSKSILIITLVLIYLELMKLLK